MIRCWAMRTTRQASSSSTAVQTYTLAVSYSIYLYRTVSIVQYLSYLFNQLQVPPIKNTILSSSNTSPADISHSFSPTPFTPSPTSPNPQLSSQLLPKLNLHPPIPPDPMPRKSDQGPIPGAGPPPGDRDANGVSIDVLPTHRSPT